jgi:hypothetical protein
MAPPTRRKSPTHVPMVHPITEPEDVWNWPCVTSITGPHGDAQHYER